MFKQTPFKRVLFVRVLTSMMLGIVLVVLIFLLSNTVFSNNANAAASSTVNFQARLETAAGAIVPDGNYNVEFKLYDASSGGTSLWTEDYLNSASEGVRVVNGYLTVNLGSITSFPSTINWNQQLWLTMNIGGTTTGTPSWDGEMSPRIQLTAIPYAFQANQLANYASGYNEVLKFSGSPTSAISINLPDSSGTVCLQNSSSCGFVTTGSLSGSAFVQGGNSFGATAVVGTNDNYGLNLETNGSTVESLSNTGSALFKNSSNSTAAFQIQDSSGNSVLNADTTTGTVNIAGEANPVYVGDNADGSLTTPLSVYVQGNYAYVASNGTNKLVVYDISSGTPTYVGENSDSNLSSPHSVYVQGNYAYVASYGTSKLVVYNISDPSNPTYVGENSDTGNLSKPNFVYVQGNYAYVTSYGIGSNKLVVYNISDPSNPTYVGKNSTGPTTNIQSVYVKGNYAYVTSNRASNSFSIYDISSGTPVYVGENTDSNLGASNSVYVQGNYAYVTGNANNKLVVYNISDPSNPTYVGENTDSNLSSPHSVYVQGNYAYVVNYSSPYELVVYDISSGTPVYVGEGSGGSLTTYDSLFVQGNYAYVASYSSGKLAVYNLGGAYIQQLSVGGTQTGTLAVQSNASINGDANVVGGLTVGGSAQLNNGLGVAGTSTFQGGTTVNGLATPATPLVTPQGTAGTTSYSYEVAAVSANGNTTAASTAGSTTTGNATLSSSNYNLISWNPIPGAVSYNIYRTVGGATQGLIGNTVTNSTLAPTATSFEDQGASGSGSAPTTDSTGQLTVSGYATFQNATNSTTAFQVQDSSGNSVLNVDTTTSTVTVGNTTSGGVFVNNGASLNTALALSNFASNGAIGTAAATVDVYTSFTIPQTTAGITLTIPSPTDTTAGRIIYILNTGTASLTVAGITLTAGADANFVWNGSAWNSAAVSTGVSIIGSLDGGTASADGASISGNTLYLQSASASDAGLVNTTTQTFAGAKTFQADSANALQVQTTGSANVLVVDTSDSTIGVNGASTTAGYTVNVTGTINASTNVFVAGSAVCTAATGCAPTSGSGDYIQNTTSTSLQTGASFAIQPASGAVGGYIEANGADILDLANSSGITVDSFGSTGSVLIKPGSGDNSTTFFQIQPAGSSTSVLNVDTTNGRVGINTNSPAYALDVNGDINSNTAVRVGGIAVCTVSACAPATNSNNYIQNGTTVQTSANISIRSAATNAVTEVLQGANGQTSDILDLQTWNGTSTTTVDSFDASGNLTVSATGTSSFAGSLDVGSSSQLQVDSSGNVTTSGTYNSNTFSSTQLLFGGAGTASIQSASGRALNITGNAASTVSTSAGNLTLQGGSGTVSLGSSTNLTSSGALTIQGGTSLTVESTSTNALTLDSGSTGAINIGTSANAKTITIGNSTGATSLVLNDGTGALNIGTNAVAHTITLGNTTGATSVVVNCGTGACSFGTSATAHTTTVGSTSGAAATTVQAGTGAILLQNQGTGAISIANNAVNSTINIGKTGSSANTTAVNIATSTGAAQTVTVGSTASSSSLLLQGGTGNVALSTGTTTGNITLTTNNSSAQIIAKSSTDSTTAFQVQNHSGTAVLNVDTSSGVVEANSIDSIAAGSLAIGATNATGITLDQNTTVASDKSFTSNGSALFQNATDSTSAFEVKDHSNNELIGVNTTDSTVNIGYTTTATTPNTQTFSYTGSSQTFTVPTGVTSIDITLDGAQGGSGNSTLSGGSGSGGAGGETTGTLSVTPGEVLTILVGGAGGSTTSNTGGVAGYNGGGTGGSGSVSGYTCAGGGGGGASTIVDGATVEAMAGGGGGGTYASQIGGTGGGTAGGSGTGSTSDYGGGGTQTTGGSTSRNGQAGSGPATSSSAGQGGYGDTTTGDCGGGGGGGGYYGGGGGGAGTTPNQGPGGGGSGYDTLLTSASTTNAGASTVNGANSGNGQVSITYDTATNPTNVTINGTSSPTSSALTVKANGAGNALDVQDTSGDSLFSVAASSGDLTAAGTATFNNTLTANGSATFQDATDSSTAFQVNNQDSENLFTVDTQNSKVIVSNTGPIAGSASYSYTGGSQTFTIPSGITSIDVTLYGASGGSGGNGGSGGLGGETTSTLSGLTPGANLTILVGGQGGNGASGGSGGAGGAAGYNGGGAGGPGTTGSYGGGGGGGGASVIKNSSGTVLAAAGGGGGASAYGNGGGDGANGHSADGSNGSGSRYGYGATTSGPGAGGGTYGQAGSGSTGGTGGDGTNPSYTCGGGGGGGGYYGGGGGDASYGGCGGGGGGGGGSALGDDTSGTNSGNGSVSISYGVSSGLPVVSADTSNDRVCINLSSCNNALGVEGNIAASGTVTGGVGSPDYAEEITTSDPSVAAGDVVAMDPNNPGQIVKSNSPYDSELLGVISTHPGFITNAEIVTVMGQAPSTDDQRPLALSGRVPVKVDTENGPIAVGDYLTSSSTPGVAMKATGPGPVIGQAMEAYSGSGVGSITVFVQTTYYNPAVSSNSISNLTLGSLTVNGSTTLNSALTISGNESVQSLAVEGSETVSGSLSVSGTATLQTLAVNGNANVGGNLTVGGTTTVADISVGGHFITTGNAPPVTLLTAAGTNAKVTLTGNDTSGTISITAGEPAQPATKNTPAIPAPTSGDLLSIQFAKAFGSAPHVLITPGDGATAPMMVYPDKGSTTGFTLGVAGTPQPNTTYTFEYFVIQ